MRAIHAAHADWADLGPANRLYRLCDPRTLPALASRPGTLRQAVSHPVELRLLGLNLTARIRVLVETP